MACYFKLIERSCSKVKGAHCQISVQKKETDDFPSTVLCSLLELLIEKSFTGSPDFRSRPSYETNNKLHNYTNEEKVSRKIELIFVLVAEHFHNDLKAKEKGKSLCRSSLIFFPFSWFLRDSNRTWQKAKRKKRNLAFSDLPLIMLFKEKGK